MASAAPSPRKRPAPDSLPARAGAPRQPTLSDHVREHVRNPPPKLAAMRRTDDPAATAVDNLARTVNWQQWGAAAGRSHGVSVRVCNPVRPGAVGRELRAQRLTRASRRPLRPRSS